jgi:eukaryotic-like serine/threonine-protein kinase
MSLPATIGKYDIQGTLDPLIRRQVAIKTITKSVLDPAELQYVLLRFRHEAQAVGRLTHPCIAAIYDYGEDSELAYIVMELVDGKSLYQHMLDGRRFELGEIGTIIRQLLDGLGYAHAQGVIHRDVKPPNILMTGDGRVKISDFGIARIDTSTLTQFGEVMGSPGYMSPEQFTGEEIDARSDIYSAGVIAYELLAGRKPFIGSNVEIMRQVVAARPANPSQHNPGISAQLDWAVQKALAKKREERFQDAGEFTEAFIRGIEASIRLTAGVGAVTDEDDVITQRIDPNLVHAARMLSGMQQAGPAENADDAAPASGAISVNTGGRRARILFVDDEERILTALRSIFRADYHVFTATNGPEALEFAGKFKPHVVVSDQRMPDMPGVELLRRVKETAPSAVRILLTGYSDLAAIVGSINDGEVYRFIAKPWDNRDIRKTIAEAATIGLELADAPLAPATLPSTMSAAVLVIESEQEIFRAVREMFGAVCPVLGAASLEEAFDMLRAQEVALILADIGNDSEESLLAFKLLKREHPEILVMALTATSDSELMIELINQAQIFRFLNKPVNLRLLKQHVQAALARYLAFQRTPLLVQQHRVEETATDSALGQKILERVSTLRNWFGTARK